MLGIDFGRGDRTTLVIESGAVYLRPGEPRDALDWIDLRERSRAHLTRWEPDWRPEDAAPDTVRSRLRAQARQRRAGATLAMFVFRQSDSALVGGVSLSSIRYHASFSAQIGYWIGADFLRRGYARDAVNATLRHAFDAMGLNRVEAACQPANRASRRVLQRAGFREEGFARDYLFINGVWRDHCLYAITAADYAADVAETGEPFSLDATENSFARPGERV
ncbi:MAG: GNAT family protein [Pseudomonadota bacterium]